MQLRSHRTKIVCTIGPASHTPDMIRQLINAGMSVARLNFSHGDYDYHAGTVKMIREISEEMSTPIALLQDLQGPKIRVGQLPDEGLPLTVGGNLTLVPVAEANGQADTVAIDYPFLAEEAEPGTRVLMDDGLLELEVASVAGTAVKCRVVQGGLLKSRKGVNLPSLNLRLPSMTEKDKQDLEFGLSQGIDWVALSFVRKAEDIHEIRTLLQDKGFAHIPVLAKIEKPQAVENMDAIVAAVDGIMVARGDMGVEIYPEKVPLIQKRLIKACNQRGIPVITATQMLDSMIKNPRPTRAEASDVANAILDGTDAVMLSGESAVGDFPVQAVEMMARIACEVEPSLEFANLPPNQDDDTHAISEAITAIVNVLHPRYIAVFTTTGYSANLIAAERPPCDILAFTPNKHTYYRLCLTWGATPFLIEDDNASVEQLSDKLEATLRDHDLVQAGDRVLMVGDSPLQLARRSNFLKILTIQ